MNGWGFPPAQGLYDPAHEHDACGVGFVVDIKGRVSRAIVEQSLTVLKNLLHRGACGCETNTGDGAGILVQMPHQFLHRVGREAGLALPDPGEYGAGLVFLPRHRDEREQCEKLFKRIIAEEGQSLIGWRDLPTDDSPIGPSARAAEPHIRQIFIARSKKLTDAAAFERKLYVIRKRVEHAVWNSEMPERKMFYLPSLSSRTLIYKGMLSADQIETMYPDITAPDFMSALALVHQRFSTNTFPSWPLAHPYRYLAHNGEINTLRGNINRMHAREELCASPLLPEMKRILPIVIEGGSDSAIFDNVLEFLVMAGRPLPHAVMMMIPEPWAGHETMSEEKKAFYEYHGCLMEPWDGPASIAFTDGSVIGAVLDRNGLRPSRYWVTKDGLVVMASEVGVLDIPPENILLKERLHPGRMFLVDTQEGRIVDDEEIKHRYASEHPYGQWLKTYLLPLESLPEGKNLPEPDPDTLLQRQQLFGYTLEDLRLILGPMAENKAEPVGSMGTDTSLAVLSNRPRLLYDYFKQLFAQVTNPPLDAIREELVTQMSITVGPEGNLLDPQPESCQQVKLQSPILKNEELARLWDLDLPDLKSKVLPILFPVAEGAAGLAKAMDDLCNRASQAIDSGYNILILTDRGVNKDMAAIPALLAVSGVHHHLVREATRTTVGLVIDTGEAREVHHCALLIGYGASAVTPRLAFETLGGMIRQGALRLDYETAVNNYVKALNKGILKVMSKMGISTVQSYCGAQIFEAVGLRQDFVDRYFTGTASRVEGIGIDVVAEEVLQRHRRAFPDRPVREQDLDPGGEYQWRRDGEYHLFNPETVFKLQHATRTGQWKIFKEYTTLVDNQSKNLATLRGLMELKYAPEPIPIDEVEPIESILLRFSTGAMSYGSISQEAHETLAIAMNRMGARSNTGEGGEDPARYVPDANGDLRRSAIKQVASGRFGVTSEYLVNALDLQIKMAQGAKPGEGGQLPGGKVYPWIAKVRYSTPGVGLISPPPHHDIYSIEDLAQLIYDLKNANPEGRVHVKLVAEVGVGTVAAGVAKGHADVVLISGHDGGTGASPLTSIKYGGIPWELGLAETHQTLVLNNLRGRIRVETDGQMKTGRDVVIATLLGAEEYGFATAPLIVEGCIMMRKCHLNTCPVGIATQDPELRKKFNGKPEHIVNYLFFVAEEARHLMAKLGFRTINEMVGRVDKLKITKAVDHWKARGLDLSPLLMMPEVEPEVPRYCVQAQDHGLENILDNKLVELCRPAIEKGERVMLELPIRNVNRTTGTMLSSKIAKKYGLEGLPEDTISIKFNGSAGQSFGAFLARGITLILEGESNDYLG
ncbi:MAG TPA: glutamate synthase large subunit, partial [Terriglobia bacterium]|nr:glutamate synthase large subunit [Terriglobia bacterium]